MRVSINIVTWNDARYLDELFASLRAQTFRDFTVRIFENGSTDGETIPYLLREEPHWLAARSTKHVSTAAAKNQLIRLAMDRDRGNPEEHLILLAEADTVWHPEMLAHLVKKVEEDLSVDAVQPKMLRAFSERGDFDADTVHSDIIDSTGGEMIGRWTLHDRGAGVMDREQYDRDPNPVLPTNGILLIRATALKDIAADDAVFDETFVGANEDVDFAFRFTRAGHITSYVPAARAHRYRGTAVETPSKYMRTKTSHAKDGWILSLKHGGALSVITALLLAPFLGALELLPLAFRRRRVAQEQSILSFKELHQTYRARA